MHYYMVDPEGSHPVCENLTVMEIKKNIVGNYS